MEEQRAASDAFVREIRTITLDGYLERLDETGWTEGYTDDEIAFLTDRVRRAWVARGPAWAFYALADVSFPAECIAEEGPDSPHSYCGMIARLGERSRGRLRFERLSDRLDLRAERAEVLLYVAGRRYEAVFEQPDGYFREEALEPLHRALADQEHGERFLPLPPHDQRIHLAFVTPVARWRAVELSLVPDAAFYAPR